MKYSQSVLETDRDRSIPIITLTTDFGLRDHFVGVLKGIFLKTLPSAQLIDISHDLPRHDIISAAFIINEAFPYFPSGTVHLAVVDPGVGTARRMIVVVCCSQFFVAPDNGLLSYLLHQPENRAYEIKDSDFLKLRKSSTFAGRDHFAPIAAALATGTDPSALGEEIDDAKKIEGLALEKNGTTTFGKIIYFDHFGNAIINIKNTDVPKHFKVEIGGETFTELKSCYAEGDEAQANLIINSSEWLEVFVPGQSAKAQMQLNLMDVVVLETLE